MIRVWTKRAAISAAVVLVVASTSRAAARRFLFPVQDLRPAGSVSDLVEHRLTAHDGVAVRALELAPGAKPARWVVHFHNNRETAEAAAPLARDLRARGLGVVLAEYRGYGSSAGTPSEEGLYADAEAVLAMLAARGIGPERIVLWGTSLGTGVAAEMARRGRGGALVLVTPYTSIPDLVTNVAPFVPARALLPDRFETLSKAPGIQVPALVVHGDADEIVPFEMGVRLAAALPSAQLLRVPHGRHGDLLVRDRTRILDAIAALAQR